MRMDSLPMDIVTMIFLIEDEAGNVGLGQEVDEEGGFVVIVTMIDVFDEP